MNDPVRLRDTGGAAGALLSAGKLQVPHASRQRALAFTGVAASVAATGTAAAAGATSLVKSVMLCVCLGTVGGGVASLAVSETLSRVEATQVDVKPAAAPRKAVAKPLIAAAPQQALEVPAAPTETSPAVVEASPISHDGRIGAVAPTPGAAPNSSSKAPRAASLFDEQRIIESARAAVSRGDTQSALSTLDGYTRSNPQGQFGPEALALRIEALSARGDLTRARSLAADFRQRYPHHPLLASVQTAVQNTPSPKR